MRLLICAGGTGGGVYPALAVLQAIRDREGEAGIAVSVEPGWQPSVLWVGSTGGMEADLVKRAKVPFDAISAAGVHGVGLRALPGNIVKLVRGYRNARRVLQSFKPDVLFFTGGYVAVPMAVAGRGVRSVLFVPDIEPGLALKTIARFADQIALSTHESRSYFGNQEKLVVTGYPVRQSLMEWDLDEARLRLGLSGELPTLLVYGGSIGARSINKAIGAILSELLLEMQVVHLTGYLDWEEIKREQSKLAQILDSEAMRRYRAYPYLHEEMGAALTAADLVVARAGASALGEFPHFGLPAILVPYPHAWRYQEVNARYLAQRGAAEVIRDEDLSSSLLALVRELMQDETRRHRMGRAMRSLSQPEAAKRIAALLQNNTLRSDKEKKGARR